MTNLVFTKAGGRWEATATVTKNFNLHIEGGGSLVSVYQKTAGTKYGMVEGSAKTGDCYDYDFTGEVWPKSVKVVCDKEPSVGVITEAAEDE